MQPDQEIKYSDLKRSIKEIHFMDLDACITNGFQRFHLETIRGISIHTIRHCLLSAIAMNRERPQLLVVFK